MKSILIALLIFIPFALSLKGYSQTIMETNTNPAQTQKQCSYYYADASGLTFNYWLPPSNCAISATGGTFNLFLYLKWKNIEASAYPSIIQAQFRNNLYQTITVSKTVGPFVLTLPAPSFVGGSSRNIPCHVTSPFTISLNDYKNTSNNAVDYNTVITSTFEWTLPSGWQTNSGQTGTFVGSSSITVIPPVSSTTASISVKAKANTQKSTAATLQITRDLEDFTISGSRSVVYKSAVRYDVPNYPGISYSWQLPIEWIGNSTSNYIDVIVGCNSGNLRVTMTGCNGTKSSETSITTNIIAPGTTISGSDIVCASGAQFSVPNLASGTNITWNSSSNLTLSNASSNYCTYSANSDGEGWIEATINAPACGISVTLPRKTVWAGKPVISHISGANHVDTYGMAVYEAVSSSIMGATYNWSIFPSGTVYSYGRTAGVHFQGDGDYRIEVNTTNICGTSPTAYHFVGVGIYDPYIFYPNPGDDYITLQANEKSDSIAISATAVKSDNNNLLDIKIFNEKGSLVKVDKTKSLPYTLHSRNIPEGKYILQVIKNGKMWSKQLIIKRH